MTNGAGGAYLYYCVSGPTQGCICEMAGAAGSRPEYPHVTIIAGCKCSQSSRADAFCYCGKLQLNVLCEVPPPLTNSVLRSIERRTPGAPRAARPCTA